MQQNKPLLSVLIPAFNAEKYIAQAIQSVLRQTYTNLEILICDDGSSDRTFAVCTRFRDSRIRMFRNEQNSGKNRTSSFLLDHSTGDYITVHDADDISLPGRFEAQITFLEKNPDYAMCGTNFISFLENGTVIDRSKLETDATVIRKKIESESQFHGPTVVFRKNIFTAVGGFYRYFTRAEDIDLTMRIAEKFKATNLADHLYLYRHVSTSLTNDIYGYSLERWGHAKLLYFLAEQRKANNGIDSIMEGDFLSVEAAMKKFTHEYEGDPTVAYRKGVFRLLGMKMYSNAVRLSWIALKEQLILLNVKCFVYAVLASCRGYFQILLTREKVNLDFLK